MKIVVCSLTLGMFTDSVNSRGQQPAHIKEVQTFQNRSKTPDIEECAS